VFSDEKNNSSKVMHRKLVFLKVESSVIEISENIDLDAVTLLVL